MPTYKIIIEDNTNKQFSPIAGQDTSNMQQPTANKNISAKDIGLFVAYKKTKPFVSQILSNEVQKVGLRTGSNRLQEKANFYHSVLSTAWSMGESIAVGASVGGLPGALGGLALSSLSTLITYTSNREKLEISKMVEDETIRLNTIRAGAKGSRRA